MVVLKGYDGEREVWAVAKTYGSGETAESFICLVDPNVEIRKEYKRPFRVLRGDKKGR